MIRVILINLLLVQRAFCCHMGVDAVYRAVNQPDENVKSAIMPMRPWPVWCW